MTQMKEQIKAPEKIQLSNEQIANLSGAEFKTLVIRMLTEMLEYSHKIEQRTKTMRSEIKRTNNEGKDTGTHNNDLEQKEERNIQPGQNEEIRIPKNEERLRNLQDSFNVSTSKSQGCQKEKRKSKKLKTYLKT